VPARKTWLVGSVLTALVVPGLATLAPAVPWVYTFQIDPDHSTVEIYGEPNHLFIPPVVSSRVDGTFNLAGFLGDGITGPNESFQLIGGAILNTEEMVTVLAGINTASIGPGHVRFLDFDLGDDDVGQIDPNGVGSVSTESYLEATIFVAGMLATTFSTAAWSEPTPWDVAVNPPANGVVTANLAGRYRYEIGLTSLSATLTLDIVIDVLGTAPLPGHVLTVNVQGHGSVAPNGGTYTPGTVVTLTAAPDAGYRLKSWAGTDDDGSKANTNTVTMTGPKTVTVVFEPIPATPHLLTTSVVGGHGTLSPPSGPQNEGVTVTLTASPDPGYRVKAWTGTDDDGAKANTNTVTMTGPRTVTVEFERISATRYTLTVGVVGGHGTVAPTSGSYEEGTVVPLTVTPDAGYRVVFWSGTDDDGSTANTNTVTMDGHRTVTVELVLEADPNNVVAPVLETPLGNCCVVCTVVPGMAFGLLASRLIRPRRRDLQRSR